MVGSDGRWAEGAIAEGTIERALRGKEDNRLSPEKAGYMELEGAIKDADCKHVCVPGGVSSELGCCNEFAPNHEAREFECGTCTFLIGEHKESEEEEER